MPISTNNKRVAKNTLALYFRSILNLFIGLYTVRIVLRTLGESDYGIYSVVGGILAFLTFLSASLYTGNQRFFSFYLGKGDEPGLKKIFGASLTVYILFALGLILIGEPIGVWFINSHLNIASDRLFAANVIYQISIISSAIGIFGAPYYTAIMAHEDMHVFGWIAIYDAVVKLLICYLLVISPWDKLISYSLLLGLSGIISTAFTIIYAHLKYKECRFHPLLDKSRIKELTTFSGWNLFGSFGWIVKNQGLSILLNLFFGTIVNAAQGIAMSVRNYAATFSANFGNAVAPQIVKSYATNDKSALATLLYRSSKMTFFLMMIVVVPLFFCIDFILQIWIGNHTQYMNIFCQIMLLEALIDSISYPMASANQATGKIAAYQTLIGFFEMITLPVAYILLKLGLIPEWAFIVSLISQVFVVGVRTAFLSRIYTGAVKGSLKNIFLPCTLVSIITFSICAVIQINIENMVECIAALVTYFGICVFFIWCLGFSSDEKAKIKELAINKIPFLKCKR